MLWITLLWPSACRLDQIWTIVSSGAFRTQWRRQAQVGTCFARLGHNVHIIGDLATSDS